MTIVTMPNVLSWSAGKTRMHEIYRSYSDLLSENLGRLLHAISTENAPLAEALNTLMANASDAAFSRVLTAPEVSYRLIWHPMGVVGNAEFLRDALLAEQAREGRPIELSARIWTALGDTCIGPNGRMEQQPCLPWSMPLDFGSPYARSVDLGNGEPDGERPPFSADEVAGITNLIRDSCERIGRVSRLVLDFTVDFNKVVVLQKDAVEPDGFTSGSTGQFVGRSFLVNPHLPSVDAVMTAEGLVHEAIHSLLYMQERSSAWVETDELYGPVPIVVSPWSGNKLALRPYMQACFVWYGLLHFWCLALGRGVFDEVSVRARIAVALSGFLTGPLLERLAPWRHGINADVADTIAALQDRVMSARALAS